MCKSFAGLAECANSLPRASLFSYIFFHCRYIRVLYGIKLVGAQGKEVPDHNTLGEGRADFVFCALHLTYALALTPVALWSVSFVPFLVYFVS